MSRYVSLLLVPALLAGLTVWAARPAPTETLLGPLTADALDEFGVSAHPREGVLGHMGVGADGKPAYVVNGRADVAISSPLGLLASADGAVRLYLGDRDGKQVIVRKVGDAPGVILGEYAQVRQPILAARTQRAICVATRDGKELVVVDGVEGAAHADVRDGSLLLTPDESTLVYIATEGGKAMVMKRDLAAEQAVAAPGDPPAVRPTAKETKGPAVDEIGFVKLSLDGRRLAYTARVGKQWTVVVVGLATADADDLPDAPPAADAKAPAGFADAVKIDAAAAYDQITSLAFGPDGGKLYWVARVARKMFVIADGTKLKEGDAIAGLFFLGDGTMGYVTARWATKPPQTKPVAEYQIVIGDTTSEGFDWLNPEPILGGTSHCAFRVMRDRKHAYLIDGALTAWYDNLTPLIFSQDGAHYLFTAQLQGKYTAVHDGRAVGTYAMAQVAAMSPDGTRAAVAAREGARWAVSINGAAVGTHDEVAGLTFTPDGKHLCYAARIGGEWSLAINGTVGTRYERLLGFLTMDDAGPLGTSSAVGHVGPGRIRYFGWKGGKAYLVEEALP